MTRDLTNQKHHPYSGIDVCKKVTYTINTASSIWKTFAHKYRQVITWVADNFASACMKFLSTTM